MTHSTDAKTLTSWMAGEFSNFDQALANSALFAHIKVCMRPMPQDFFGGYGLFLEQAYSSDLGNPYRLRAFQVKPVDDHLELVHYKPKEEIKEKFFGASRDLSILKSVTMADLEPMPGCDMIVTFENGAFKGVVQEGRGCKVFRNNRESYLDNRFEITEKNLISIDRGRDPETDEIVWGSLAGAFEFKKIKDFSSEVV
ncbi:chromophore lyase CpcT/CpeT [[Limnothrix rosea] IAM M-220]|uniref:chromophore lyase CpcT/CpeT n=1 Tax=[Limnothrix rosea] IAM M-220 TaxID=454133 RepID=UPI00095E1BDE|nr:chromophore lyase CpcT/CpeT [[Limnothrix rosea] IAM M-220]OKH18769.1 chorismate-binding protein [[Limnothrix rosea] IAM M-220]